MTDYSSRPGGVLFPNRDASGNKPSHSGNIVLSEDALRYAVAEVKAGRPAKLEIAAWTKQGRNGDFLSIGEPKQPRERPQQSEGQSSGGWNDRPKP